VTEIAGADNTSELRLQLIQGTNAQSSDALVISQWKVETVGDTKRVMLVDSNGAASPIDVLKIIGTDQADTLILDQSILSLADGVKIEISLGEGSDTIVGPKSSAGLVWSLNSLEADGVGGRLSILKPAGDG